MWKDEDCSLSPKKNTDDWDSEGHSEIFRNSFRPTSPLSLTDLNMWDTRSRFTAQSSAWCGMASVSGSGFLSKVSTSVSGSSGNFRHKDPDMRRWQSLSCLAPKGASRSFNQSPGPELRAALEESSIRRAELVQMLREAHEHLDSQTDLVRAKDTQLQHSLTTAQLLDMKHKQLAEAVSALEQEKAAAELSRFEESRQRGELHEKVLQLEMDLLKMRSTMDRGSIVSSEKTHKPFGRALPVTQEDVYRQENQKVDRELCKLREALREAEARANTQDEERSQALQQLQTSREAQRTLLSQVEEMNQKLSHITQSHTEVQKQLSEANSKLSQACLEKALLSTQLLKLEDNVNDIKAKLSAALSDKDRLIQDNSDLRQRSQSLQLQLERVQQCREGFTDQVCDLHEQLAEAKSQNNKQDQETSLIKEELVSVKDLNKKLTCELEVVKQRLEISQSELHELTAKKVTNTSQVTEQEAERTQPLGRKEQLPGSMSDGGHAELTEMREKYCHLRESWDALELENQRVQDRCLCLESEILEKEEKLHLQVEEYQKLEAQRVQTIEELRAVASHWNEKWQEVSLTLNTTQAELDELKKKDLRCKLQEEAAQLAAEVDILKRERQKDKEEIESLLQHKANMETVPNRAKKDSLLKVELDACKQELELERSRSQALLHRCKGKDKGGEAVQTHGTQTLTELSIPLHTTTGSSTLWQRPSDSSSSQNNPSQVQVELQKVWDMLQTRDTELKELQQELQSARGQVCLHSSEVEKLELQLSHREKELRGKENALESLERLREAEKMEAQVKISALELKLKGNASGDNQDDGGLADVLTTDSLRAEPQESRKRAHQLQPENNLAVQRLQKLRQLYPGKGENSSLESKTDKTLRPVHVEQDKQRRMVTEQLKSLFKERQGGGKETGSAAAQTGGSSLKDWVPKSEAVKTALDTLHSQRRRQQELQGAARRNWQQGAGLMPVSEEEEEEEEEEDTDQPGGDKGALQQVAHDKEELHHQSHQLPAETVSEKSSNAGVPSLSPSSAEGDLLGTVPCLYPDGIFQARLVDIYSPDEDEDEEDVKKHDTS
ncbi:myosin-11 [Myripristis murdjan]|uniref:myosin-11 n=1 Tax=Myripristis murdjan TaxID=586833 RepID=UPI0011764774|nr:myosin-11-like [Myripristis murdjan]